MSLSKGNKRLDRHAHASGQQVPVVKEKKRVETRLMWAVGWLPWRAGIQAGSFLDTFQRLEKYRTN